MDPRNTSEMIYVDIRIELIWHPKWNNYYYFVVSKHVQIEDKDNPKLNKDPKSMKLWIRMNS